MRESERLIERGRGKDSQVEREREGEREQDREKEREEELERPDSLHCKTDRGPANTNTHDTKQHKQTCMCTQH